MVFLLVPLSHARHTLGGQMFSADSSAHTGVLKVRDWASLIPLAAAVGGVTYLTYKAFCPRARPDQKKATINPNIKKNVEKVVDMFDLEDIGEKVAFCRCWRSKNFPYCDGSHTPHNRETGDNVGPVCLSRKK